MRRFPLDSFYVTTGEEADMILDDENLVIGLEQDGENKIIIMSAKHYNELVLAHAKASKAGTQSGDSREPLEDEELSASSEKHLSKVTPQPPSSSAHSK